MAVIKGLGNIIHFFLFLALALPANSTAFYIPWIDFIGCRLIADSPSVFLPVGYRKGATLRLH